MTCLAYFGEMMNLAGDLDGNPEMHLQHKLGELGVEDIMIYMACISQNLSKFSLLLRHPQALHPDFQLCLAIDLYA